MEGQNYSKDAINTTLSMLSPLTLHSKSLAVVQFIKIAKKGLSEEECHYEFSQVVEELCQVPTPKNATKAMVQKTIAPYVQRDGLTVYLNSRDIQDITSELLSRYSNIYCSSSTDSNGGQTFYVNSKGRHVKFVEILVR